MRFTFLLMIALLACPMSGRADCDGEGCNCTEESNCGCFGEDGCNGNCTCHK